MKEKLTILMLLATLHAMAQQAGALDPSFGNGGKVVTSLSTGQDKAYGVAMQPDGKILVAGQVTSTLTGKDFALVRYNSDGTLDATFGANGVATTDVQLGSDDVAYALALQADGKIVVAGHSDDGTDKDAAIVRYNDDGTLDNTFGSNGIVLTDFDDAQQDEIKVVKIHALTGNIIVGGASIISSSVSKPVVARYLSNGTLDDTFNSTGIRLLWITNLDYQYLHSIEDLIVQTNGKINAVGWRDFPGLSWDSDYWACRINSDGTMDNTFSSDGLNVSNGGFNGHDRGYAMLLKPNNNILMAGGGYISTLGYDFSMFEINANGSTGSWSALADWGSNSDDVAYGLLEDVNGKYVLAGSSGTTTARSFALARFNTNSSLDNGFGTSGKVTTTFGNALNECFDVVMQSDNKIVAVGYTGNDIALARYLGVNVPQLDNFELMAPADLSTELSFASFTFDWSNAFGATSYEIDIDVSPTFSGTQQTFTVSSSSYGVTDLQVNTQYYWRVRASDGTNWGAYSDTWSFTTNSLDNFNLLYPADNAVDQNFASLSFDWSANTGASTYELQVDTTQDFSTSPQTYTATNSGHTATLLPSKTYFWRVRAGNGALWGQWTDVWSFTTGTPSSVHELRFADLKLYPNPTGGLVTIEGNRSLLQEPYVVLDHAGREILSGQIDSETFVLDLKGMAVGIYLLRIGGNSHQTYKLVKE